MKTVMTSSPRALSLTPSPTYAGEGSEPSANAHFVYLGVAGMTPIVLLMGWVVLGLVVAVWFGVVVALGRKRRR